MSDHSNKIFKSTDYQELFNAAYAGIITQGQPSVTKDRDVCLYTDHNGNHCGVGHCLMPAALDIVSEDEYDVDGMIEAFAAADFEWDYDDEDNIALVHFLQELQAAHDQASQGTDNTPEGLATFMNLFENNMCRVAATHALSVPDT